jgi:fucose 4-O-acetylase-like acetyltransferase
MLLMGQYKDKNEIFKRIEVFKLSLIMIILLLLALPNTKIPIITMIGRNSLYIYLFHRIFTLLFTKHYGLKVNLLQIMKKSLIGTIIIVIVFGNDYITKYLNLFIDFIYINMSLNTKKGRFIKLIFFLLFILIILSKPLHEKYYGMLKKKKKKKRKKK